MIKKGQCIRGTEFDRQMGKDESGVPAAQLANFLSTIYLPASNLIVERSGLTFNQVARILEADQKIVSLGVADRFLDALDLDVCALVNEGMLVVIPLRGQDDALAMAVYENVDDDDCLMVPWREVIARADELMDLREMLLSGDPEQIQSATEIAVL